jgi:dihydrofolate synthase/folylpolyglutamate synthase
MNYLESLDYLYSLQKSGIKFGLENSYKLLDYLNNPQNNFKSIHIAGTNGKGSTSTLIASILSEMNFNVGLYTSPHLVRFNERIRINGKEIEDDYLVSSVNQLKKLIEEIKPTFFEVTTAIAFKYFSDNKVDYAVIETGLGGRLDSTNVIKPQLSVITKIDFDHKEYLGDTIEKIAREKGGIIKPGVPVVVAKNQESVKKILYEMANQNQSEVIFVDENYTHTIFEKSLNNFVVGIQSKITGNEYKINSPLIGDFQIENIKNAIAAIEKLFLGENLIDKISKGIRDLKFPIYGRFQIIRSEPMIILDTSHNSDAIKNFLKSLNELVKGRKVAIFGIMKDKEIDDSVKMIEESFDKIHITQAKIERSLDAKKLAEKFTPKKVEIFESVEMAIFNSLSTLEKDFTIVVFGSNYIVGEGMEYLKKVNLL